MRARAVEPARARTLCRILGPTELTVEIDAIMDSPTDHQSDDSMRTDSDYGISFLRTGGKPTR